MIDFPANPTLGQSFNSVTGGVYTWDGVAWSLIATGLDRWAMRGIGEIYMLNTALTGVEIPPATTDGTVWIELTAGLTGAGAFNNGKLTTESVTGSAPLVNATAVIALSGSPMNGQTVDLINTEGRILRPSTSPGTKQTDAFQSHKHTYPAATSTANNLAISGSAPSGTVLSSTPIDDGVNGTPRLGNETRMKNVGVKAYMRIK
jgi:hypothetical protein